MNRKQSAKLFSNPHEEAALQSVWKQTLKAKIFKGFYQERRYVEVIKEYRDLITLHPTEKELKSLLDNVCNLLSFFYRDKNSSIWIGITTMDSVSSATAEICIWSELGELAFGQYWFSVKTLKFRSNEVIVKLKTIRSVESTDSDSSRKLFIPTTLPMSSTSPFGSKAETIDNLNEVAIGMSRFLELFSSWGTSIKESVYNFMSTEISKNNITNMIKFTTLLVFSLLVGAVHATKMLGFFMLRFMAELSQFTRAATPIVLAIIDMGNKIVGGFYILLAMIWRDTVSNKTRQDLSRRSLPLKYESIYWNANEFNKSADKQNVYKTSQLIPK